MTMLHVLAGWSDFWMPPRASSVSGDVDGLFNFIMWISIFFFVLILVLMVVFVWRYRYRGGDPSRSERAGHSTALELTWTIIPTVLVVIIFYYGFRSYLDMAVAPPNAYEIQVTARTWSWSFTYPNGAVTSELHVPIDVPIRLVLSSDDVIHSFFVPAFRLKRDAVPGRFNRMWFTATRAGTYDVFCAEYCGRDHSEMRTIVVVHPTMEEFRSWLEEAGNVHRGRTPVEAGRLLVEQRGCLSCHSLDGSRGQGPTFTDLFGAQRPLVTGQTVLADEDYISESILVPNAKVTAGYPPVMPSFAGQFKPEDIRAIIAFLKTQSVHFQGDPAELTQPAATQPAQPPAAPDQQQ
jgi:cytochrome c oxidase subunit II